MRSLRIAIGLSLLSALGFYVFLLNLMWPPSRIGLGTIAVGIWGGFVAIVAMPATICALLMALTDPDIRRIKMSTA
jgi:hypothetical protein